MHELCERNERGSIRLLGPARRSDRANKDDLPAVDPADEQPPRLVQAAMKEWQAVRKVGRRRVSSPSAAVAAAYARAAPTRSRR